MDMKCGDNPSLSPSVVISSYADEHDFSGYNNPHGTFNSLMTMGFAYFRLGYYPWPDSSCISLIVSPQRDQSNSRLLRLYYRGVCEDCDDTNVMSIEDFNPKYNLTQEKSTSQRQKGHSFVESQKKNYDFFRDYRERYIMDRELLDKDYERLYGEKKTKATATDEINTFRQLNDSEILSAYVDDNKHVGIIRIPTFVVDDQKDWSFRIGSYIKEFVRSNVENVILGLYYYLFVCCYLYS
jgi:hypothetical protein